MQIIPLYKYERPGGGITVSRNKPNCDYTEKFRLIADEGKNLQKGEVITYCVDVDSSDGWVEIDAPEDEVEDYTVDGTATGELDPEKI